MKPMCIDELFNRRVIIRKLESSLNDADIIDASVVLEGKTEASVVAEVVHKDAITVGGVYKEVEATVVTEKIIE